MVFSILSFNNCVHLQIAIQGGIYSCYNFKITQLSKYITMYNYVIKKWQIHSDKKYWALPAFEFATFRSRKIWNNSLTDRAKKSLRFFLFAVLQNERQVYHKLCIQLWLRYSSWEFVACSLDECWRGGGGDHEGLSDTSRETSQCVNNSDYIRILYWVDFMLKGSP